MNLCGSSGGGGVAREVKPDHCFLAKIDFRGAMMVDLGLRICKKKKKKTREGEERADKCCVCVCVCVGGGGGGGGGGGAE